MKIHSLPSRVVVPVFIFFFVFSNSILSQNPREVSSQKSVAVIIKISGDRNKISGTEVFKMNIYEGHAKNLHADIPPNAPEVLKIKALDSSGNIIYEGFHKNPLYENLESFEEDGTVNNNQIPFASGYINVRFPVSDTIKDITINVYSFKNDEETLASTLKFNIR